MMSLGSADPPHAADNGKEGNERKSCPLYGCQRVYKNTAALESHLKDHDVPAPCLPGKVFLCSNIGCSGSFPNMQKLMEHMRHHHKPNIYFLCESCRAKLRSYKGLLTHLHTCSKVPRSKMRAVEPAALPVAKPSTPPTAADPDAPQLDAPAPSLQIQSTDPAGVSQPNPAGAPLLNPPCLTRQEPLSPELYLQQFPEAASQLQTEASPPPLGPAVTPEPPEPQSRHPLQTKSPQSVQPAPGPSLLSPPGSAAVWKKNHGPSGNKRILWEHTRGHYRCVQCGHSAANRRDMTSHIKTQHSARKAAGGHV